VNQSGIAFGSEDLQLRERLQKMTDEQLVKFGKASRSLRNSENPAFRVQWEQAHADGGEGIRWKGIEVRSNFGPSEEWKFRRLLGVSDTNEAISDV